MDHGAPTRTTTTTGAADIRPAEDEATVRALFPLMRQLRPHLASADELVVRWRRQAAAGYRIIALYDNDKPMALAGYREQENLVYGHFFYVDDLVTDDSARSHGYGEALMTRLKEIATGLGCARFTLDTPMSNSLGHRFYFRNGLLASAFRFGMPLPAGR